MRHQSRAARVLWRGLAAPLALGGLISAVPAGAAGAAGAAACQVQGSPQPVSPASDNNELHSVAVISGCDTWAVGFQVDKTTGNQKLIEHFDGTAWKVVPAPPAGTSSELNGVSAVSASDVYAVGDFSASGVVTPLVLHWNGSAWAAQTVPGVDGLNIVLTSVRAVSANDVWAGGFTQSGKPSPNARQPVILHWNGSAWARMPLPPIGAPDDDVRVFAVGASSRSDAWAVGDNLIDGADRPFILHWNGQRWTRSLLLAGPRRSIDLNGVTATSPSDAWAVGSIGSSPAQTLILRWNGVVWLPVDSPDPGGRANEAFLLGVTATSRARAWAVGRFTSGDDADALLLRWNGFRWVTVPVTNPGHVNELIGVSAGPPGDVWAAGSALGNSGPGKAFAVHCC